MKDILDLLSNCKKKGIVITIDEPGNNLKAHGNLIMLSDLEKEFIKNNKTQIIDFLIKIKNTTYSRIEETKTKPVYPLSSAQKRLWMLSQFQEGSVAYHIPGVFIFEGDLNRLALMHAFKALIVRHESLRTIFKEEKGDVYQVIQSPDEHLFELVYTDLQMYEDNEERVKNLITDELSAPFDLTTGPLLRAGLYQLTVKRWVFSFVMHHIIGDGWSIGILIKELLLFYNNYKHGLVNSISPLRIQYKDYAAWQQNQLSDESLNRHREYWLKQFEGELPVLELHGDYRRPAVKTYHGGSVTTTLNPVLSQKLKALCREHDSTLFMGLLAGVNVLLYRYTGQSDIIVGSPVAGREHADLENQIGFYVNTLALRSRFSGTEHYLDLLDQVKITTVSAYEHQSYPFDELVEALSLERDMSRNPLFDTWVVLHNKSDITHINEQHAITDLSVSVYNQQIESKVSRRDLTFTFVETDEEIELSLGYNSDIYSREIITQMTSHYVQLIEVIVEDPLKPLQELEYLNPSEKEDLLNRFNYNYANEYKTIIDWFEDQAQKTPDDAAVVFEGTSLSYRELNERANRLGNYLKKNYHIGANDLVGIRLDRSEWMIISILGVIKSGGAYVPIDPDYPQERVDYMIEDSECKVLIDDQELEKFQQWADQYGSNNPKVGIDPHDLVYVIYTSGSTGKPKGVMISHKALIDYVFGILNKTNIKECKRFGLVSTIAADLGNTIIYTSLLIGGSLHVFSTAEITNPEKLRIADLDCLKIVPSHWKALQGNNEQFVPAKCLIFGGESLTDDVIALLKANELALCVYNHYGPSETTIGKLIKCIDLKNKDLRISLGTPIGNNQVYILDEQERVVPKGVIGEICIAGEGLANGYLRRSELTTEKFPANPFIPGERMYKTGDLGRLDQSLNIEFFGRKDDQIKIRGYRIELGEIESVLMQHESISMAVVLVKQDSNQDKKMITFLTGEAALNTKEVQKYLEGKLPGYMVPSLYHVLDHIPLTANGKINKGMLKATQFFSGVDTVEYLGARNSTEEQLIAIWGDILELETGQISVKSDFFELGGHSLKAIKVVLRIQESFGVDIDLSFLFNEPTIEELANEIDNLQWLNKGDVNTDLVRSII